ncbi:MAG: dienelactone hydrolase family protein [Chloroflexota bacterium]
MQNLDIEGNSFSGYLTTPGSGEGMGVILYHAWWGLNPFIMQTCDELARQGFVALAPDLYNGALAKTIDEAKQLRQSLDRKAANKIGAIATDYLCSRQGTDRPHIGAIGFSLGCSFAIESSRSKSGIVKAVVLFYGTGGGKFDKSKAAFLGHFAENDQWGADQKKVKALERRILAAEQEVTFYTYPNTVHWFAEADRPEYNAEASLLAWDRTIKFLREQLG